MNGGSQTYSTPGEKDIATVEEARAAIEALQKHDYARLNKIATYFSNTRLGRNADARDLLQEALAKTLAGTRHWNKSVTIVKHLDRTMESDSGHMAAKRVARPTVAIQSIGDEPKSTAADIRNIIDASNDAEKVFALFSGDKMAINVIRLKAEDYSASEIRLKLGIGQTEYETISKRIRRRVLTCSENGG